MTRPWIVFYGEKAPAEKTHAVKLTNRAGQRRIRGIGSDSAAAGTHSRKEASMAGGPQTRVQYLCSFCGKNQDQVKRLIAGLAAANICDECVELWHAELDNSHAQGPRGGVR